ncbi:hypothetical protein OU787_04705 [Kitasatospora sp. YST-16]|uniref:hypothetical protein n=1 Tax=Kitasatospora sp. YST-16 TaxID=2998080 RepID=UPI002283AFF8|nr:hypothetical protein [Kitasatospora sp. YST-16]WAL70858.1 hypothetical protein OU787_04705 [Kitasatospora sp. YST-16]WNW36894.1 hypothetical protein RKE32_04675 [Streptomyces sp. Li-HN-5-13]
MSGQWGARPGGQGEQQGDGALVLFEHAGRIVLGLRADLAAFALDPLTADVDVDAFAGAAVPLTMSNGVVANRGVV